MLEAIAQLPPAQFLRGDVYAYPLVNAIHILALGFLVSSAVLMDLRILGFGGQHDVTAVVGTLRPVAIAAVVVAAATGGLLFMVQPVHYAQNPVFWTKIALVGAALANAALFVAARRHLASGSAVTRLMAMLSILLWIAAVLAGRAIGYFE